MIGYYTKEWEALAPRIVDRWCTSFSGNTGLQLPSTTGKTHGVLTNFANNGNDAYVTSPDKLALSLDGVNDYVTTTRAIPAFSQLSIGFWVNVASLTNNSTPTFFSCGTGVSARPFFMQYTAATGFRFILINNATSAVKYIRTQTPTLNTWEHYVITWTGGADNSGFQAYRNGVRSVVSYLDQGAQMSGPLPGNLVRLGCYVDFTTPFQGLLDDFIIFDTAILPTEAQFIFEQGRGGGLLYRPERRKTYFVPPVTGWQSYWFRNQQRMVGGGIR